MKENIIDKILNLHSDLKIVCYYKQYLFVENRYGICKVQKYSLLSGSKPTISTAVNKTSYFINQLFEKQPNLVVVSDYKGALMQIIVKDRYGFCESTPNRLLSGQIPCIETAIDKTDYFINQSKSIHEDRSGFWFQKVKYNSHGSIGETTLFDKEKSYFESVDVGFMFHS